MCLALLQFNSNVMMQDLPGGISRAAQVLIIMTMNVIKKP
jgi:hypothetical protein